MAFSDSYFNEHLREQPAEWLFQTYWKLYMKLINTVYTKESVFQLLINNVFLEALWHVETNGFSWTVLFYTYNMTDKTYFV